MNKLNLARVDLNLFVVFEAIYAAGGITPPPWIAEATLAVDWAALNPSPRELAKLRAAG